MIRKYECEICGKVFSDSKECIHHEVICRKNSTEMIQVAEVFVATQTTDENPRMHYIYRKLVPISKEKACSFKNIKSHNDMNLLLDNENWLFGIDNKFETYLCEYFFNGCEIEGNNLPKVISDREEYYCTGDGYIYFEAFFTSGRNYNDEIDKAYISIFNMNIDDYKQEKKNDVDIKINKWMTHNSHR